MPFIVVFVDEHHAKNEVVYSLKYQLQRRHMGLRLDKASIFVGS